jgi:hypothetical protein
MFNFNKAIICIKKYERISFQKTKKQNKTKTKHTKQQTNEQTKTKQAKNRLTNK